MIHHDIISSKICLKSEMRFMSYITEIFERLDLQHIREFLLHGSECVEISDKPYKQRIDDALKPATAMLQSKFPDMAEYDKVTEHICHYASTLEDVYMEIGMHCGATLATKLLQSHTKE